MTVNSRRRQHLRRRGRSTPPACATTGAWARPPGPTLADSKGTQPRDRDGGVTFGVPGGARRRPQHRGRASTASTTPRARNVDLSDTQRDDGRVLAEVERLRQRRRARDGVHPELQRERRRLPGRPERAAARRHVRRRHRQRRAPATTSSSPGPSAGVWHHYAFVLDTTAPAATADHALRRRQAGDLHEEPTAAPAPATSPTRRSTSCRAAATSLFGAGDLDEVALYNRALDRRDDRRPLQLLRHQPPARRRRSPSRPTRPRPAQTVTFNASGSSDPDGTIAKYEWDLDGNGTYETNTGTTPTVDADLPDRRRRSPSACGSPTTRRHRHARRGRSFVGNAPPDGRVHGHAEPGASTGQTVTLQRARPRATPTARSPSTSGTSTATGPTRPTPAPRRRPRTTYAAAGTVNVGLRVTDNGGKTATTTAAGHGQRQRRRRTTATRSCDTAGLVDYWRMGEAAGPTLADSKGTSHGDASRGAHVRRARRVAGDPNTAVRFDGTNDSASAPLDLSGTSDDHGRVLAEVERLRQRRRPGDGVHAELQRQPRRLPGRSQRAAVGGKFGVGIGVGAGAQQRLLHAAERRRVAPLRARHRHDGAGGARRSRPTSTASRSPTRSSTAAPAPATSPTPRCTSCRAPAARLFGAGDLDEVALYNRALSARDDRRALRRARHQPAPDRRVHR